MNEQQKGPPYAGFSDHIREVQEANRAGKLGIVADALKAIDATNAHLAGHLRVPRTLARLAGVAPPLQTAAVDIIAAMFILTGERLMVVSGVRGDKEQVDLYAQGRTKPGKIVTHLDGIKRRSNHQVAVDGPWKGLGCAIDFCFIDADKDAPTWDDAMPWAVLGQLAKAKGLVWGGDWPTLRDRPHVELMTP